jgi:hypothetical protein
MAFCARWFVLLLLGLWTLDSGLGTLSAAPTNVLDEASFKPITQNNIFNPRRRGRKPDGPIQAPRTNPVVDWFALVGIMNYDKGLFAFFEGSKSAYSKVEKPGDVEGALKEAFKQKERLVFLDFITDQSENVFPMIPGGKGLTEMILAEEL